MWVSAEADGTSTKSTGVCGDGEVLVVSAGTGVAHLAFPAAGAGRSGVVSGVITWTTCGVCC